MLKIYVMGGKQTGKTSIVKALRQKTYKPSGLEGIASVVNYYGSITVEDAEGGLSASAGIPGGIQSSKLKMSIVEVREYTQIYANMVSKDLELRS